MRPRVSVSFFTIPRVSIPLVSRLRGDRDSPPSLQTCGEMHGVWRNTQGGTEKHIYFKIAYGKET